MTTTLVILLVCQYRKAGSRKEFFNWMMQSVCRHTIRTAGFAMLFFIIVSTL